MRQYGLPPKLPRGSSHLPASEQAQTPSVIEAERLFGLQSIVGAGRHPLSFVSRPGFLYFGVDSSRHDDAGRSPANAGDADGRKPDGSMHAARAVWGHTPPAIGTNNAMRRARTF